MGALKAHGADFKELARDPNVSVRARLAADREAPAEILYFLAEDQALEVRRAVAENPATPRQADTILSRDPDYTVRCLLARKIVGEGLPDDERSQLWRIGFTILETLARDKLVRVRQALAEAIKSKPKAPRPIILELAHDREREVASPVIRHSPVLTEEDLVDIASGDAPDWAKAAVADRETVGPKVSEAIVRGGGVGAVASLLGNTRADIGDNTIERVIDGAAEVVEWHEPLVRRPSLPCAGVLKLARFVAAPLFAVLRGRRDVGPEAAKNLDKVARSRGIKPARPAPKPTPKKKADTGGAKQAEALFRKGKLNNEAVNLALEAGDDAFVIAALALRSGIPHGTTERILRTPSPRAVTALCWKAGHSMRFALQVQKRISCVPPGRLLNARNGSEFPMSEDEMTFQLELVTES